MNNLNFQQSIGFPFETDVLNEMQKAYTLFNALGAILGNFSIVSGCVLTGSTVSDGVVFINGEVLEFRGGLAQPNVIIVEAVTKREFEDLQTRDVIYTRYVTFGVATTQYLWANFKRGMPTIEIPGTMEEKEDKTMTANLLARIVTLEARPASNIPIGMIALWDAPAAGIPKGWEEYLPLRGRMPVGMNPIYVQGTDNTNFGLEILGNAGGEREHHLTQLELPNYDLERQVGYETPQPGSANIWSNNAGTSHTEIINSGGGDKSHNNMSPYRVVHFIIYNP